MERVKNLLDFGFKNKNANLNISSVQTSLTNILVRIFQQVEVEVETYFGYIDAVVGDLYVEVAGNVHY